MVGVSIVNQPKKVPRSSYGLEKKELYNTNTIKSTKMVTYLMVIFQKTP